MPGQPTLFNDPPLPAHNGRPTSRAAAESMRDSARTLRAKVLWHLVAVGPVGATDEEIQRALDMNANTERPRRIELVEAGRVISSGRTRKTNAGRTATVWVASTGENR